jgi:hypothetical protein
MVSKLTESSDGSVETGEVSMFATIKNLIPEPRQADQPRRYVGRHREPDAALQGTPLHVVPDMVDEPDEDLPAAEPVAAGVEQHTA